ncbi:MAG TPA: Lar family restriction alleviation protein [Aquella sp.]|nr:Lar family restriction alleviation protein [Aquella sp.]
MSEIKNCPFCGSSETQFISDDYEWFCHCVDCDSRGPSVNGISDDHKNYAIKLWNERILKIRDAEDEKNSSS